MRAVRSAFLLGVLATSALGAQTVASPAPGPWRVGFVVHRSLDSTRRLVDGSPRPLEVAIWYPTRQESGDRMSYREYFLVSAPQEELTGFIGFLASHGTRESDVVGWLDTPMQGMRAAPISGERFPLVLLAQGNGHTVQDQAPLAEYLTSHGYVVATTPSPMRLTGPLTAESQVGARASEQAEDLHRAAMLLWRDRKDLTPGRLGIIGHSFGARAALLLAMRDPRVAALVSLDGGIGTATGRASMEAETGYRAEAVRSPILHFYEELDSYMAPDFELLRSLTGADRWVQRAPLRHHLFTSLGALSASHPVLRPAIAATDSTGAAYAAVAEATVQFLDAFLKRDPAARSRFESSGGRPPLGPRARL